MRKMKGVKKLGVYWCVTVESSPQGSPSKEMAINYKQLVDAPEGKWTITQGFCKWGGKNQKSEPR